mgnify:CR=1 FL=1
MQVYKFFKLLNEKIKQYEKTSSKPLKEKKAVTIIWIEAAAE